MIKDKDADVLFKRELTKAEVESKVHFTYLDGFRLGLGIFVGLLVGSAALLVIVWLFSKVFH